MGIKRNESGLLSRGTGRWLTGGVAGAIGAVGAALLLYVMSSFHPSDVGIEAIGILFMPGAVFGLLYAGIVSLGGFGELARTPRTGVLLGFGYGLLFGLSTVIGGSFTLSTVVAGVLFGCLIGGLYAVSPYTR